MVEEDPYVVFVAAARDRDHNLAQLALDRVKPPRVARSSGRRPSAPSLRTRMIGVHHNLAAVPGFGVLTAHRALADTPGAHPRATQELLGPGTAQQREFREESRLGAGVGMDGDAARGVSCTRNPRPQSYGRRSPAIFGEQGLQLLFGHLLCTTKSQRSRSKCKSTLCAQRLTARPIGSLMTADCRNLATPRCASRAPRRSGLGDGA